MAGGRCPEVASPVPAYGFDDEEELRRERPDAMVAMVRVLRQRLPIQDRIIRMKLVKNCFSGSDIVEVIISHLDCGRKKLAPEKLNPLIHFGLCNGTRWSPTVRFFSAQGVEVELRHAAREFFLGGVDVDPERRAVYLTKFMKWYSADFFGQEKDILHYMDATTAALLTHLLNDGGSLRESDRAGSFGSAIHLCFIKGGGVRVSFFLRRRSDRRATSFHSFRRLCVGSLVYML
ncbi:hypothetical protein OPV22_002401 [Ensete ventricosum]|uniref:DUF547 domain-containing protein n=1 Tax=Ensete ventricosum TaxID=4639 RepID=A0AAV8RXT3_ENSVE|nr:hypothetical protein OPV22_002401 [Ensete ventricosum]